RTALPRVRGRRTHPLARTRRRRLHRPRIASWPVEDGLPEVAELFVEMARVPSPSGEERAVADQVVRYLRGLALPVDEDDAGAEIGSTMGNLLCRIEPTAEGTPVFFCAHLDTVPPDGPLEPVVDDGFIRNSGGTILGADNKAAVATMLEAARRVVAENRPHRGNEPLLPPEEEGGLRGPAAVDHQRVPARGRLRLRHP